MVFGTGEFAISIEKRLLVKILGRASKAGDYACETVDTGVLFFAPAPMLLPITHVPEKPVFRWVNLWQGGYLSQSEQSGKGLAGCIASSKVLLTPGHFDE